MEGSDTKCLSSNQLSLNEWHHAVFVGRGNQCFLYENGSLVDSGTYNGFTSEGKLMLGRGGMGYFDGGVMDAMGWRRALTIGEVRQLYHAGISRNYNFLKGTK